ncbi:MAG TPA: NPCBM/NEW2 domain-containing protein [Pirellulales bacterium]|jgi:hypothetical protein
MALLIRPLYTRLPLLLCIGGMILSAHLVRSSTEDATQSDSSVASPKPSTAFAIPAIGARFEGRPLEITSAGEATFQTSDGKRRVPLADLVRWGDLVDPQRGIQVLLSGGGLIVAETVRLENEQLHLDSDLLGERAVPLEFLAGIIFQTPRDLQERDRLANRTLDPAARSDRLLLENGDELSGTITSVTGTSVIIDAQGQKVAVELRRIAAAAFDPTLTADEKPSPTRTLVGLRDGSRLTVNGVVLNKDLLQVTMPGKKVWELPADSLVWFQPLSGNVVYLSDLTAEGYRHLPFLSQSWPYKNDANVVGTQLRAGGHPAAKGIGMHSAGRLTYRLDKRFRKFEADVALDDQVGDGGAVVFGVYVDDKLAWKSDVIRGGMRPQPVSVDVSGAKRLSLIVEFGERGDELDRANWLDARLTP